MRVLLDPLADRGGHGVMGVVCPPTLQTYPSTLQMYPVLALLDLLDVLQIHLQLEHLYFGYRYF